MLGEQLRLIAHDRAQVIRAAAVEVFGVAPLSVQGIGGDQSVPDVGRVQQHAEPGISLVFEPTMTWPSTAP